ncbi:MAG TPA: 2Fe-2S iron-sulfur cluster-binding protein [Bryobacteraceae bacterium]|nr:2Fe-2S iron-sulfur cluster-binding protein [Bryobacteraceae bacterium]
MRFLFQGKEIDANDGDTVAAALYRAGRRIFSRSFKYHRARGLLCVAGNCPNCLMNVDGIPNVRTCVTPVREGMEVVPQNARPSLERDWLAVSQRFDWMMPVGWYYKTFIKPKTWHTVEPFIRRVAGLGELLPTKSREYEHAWMHTDVAIAGGGYAGIQAALDAAAQGKQVILIDDQPELGGQLCYRKSLGGLPDDLLSRLQSKTGVQVLSRSFCFGLYEGNLLGVLQYEPNAKAAERLIHIRAHHVVVATGAYETPLLFPNNDLAGIMLSTGAQRLIQLYGISPGKRAVIAGLRDRAEELAGDLRGSGVEVVAIVAPQDILEATGGAVVTGLRTRSTRFSCDLIVMCGPRVPDAGLAAQAGAKLQWDGAKGAFLASDIPEQVSVVGDANGETLLPADAPLPSGKRCFVCLCSDVTGKDLCDGIGEGFDHIETLKRYTTTTMGPCQGRMCQLGAIGICAKETNHAIGETGVTTSRPPNPSVTLGALAGPGHHPIRLTPMHYAHEKLDPVWLDMGAWKRPRYYRISQTASERKCVEAEYTAVRERAGLIDVSTLGKLDVRGPDAGALLDLVYTHRFSDLKPGRVRYALMCDESGIILDDGTISRLGPDRYFVTTTTGNLDFVYQQLAWYLAGTSWNVHIANVTGGYGSMNVAGPKAREILAKLTDCDLATQAFPYMACRQAQVNGVPAILLRIGFVGETGWEIHCPAESAESVWNALLDAGQEFGIRPFGVEAQRLLRLEKRHVIVGVDTDALTNPYEADLGWAAKLDKPEFSGKSALTQAAGHALRERLVGFVLPGREVPPDGAAIVENGKPTGRVTSSRYSPAKQATVGLAWVSPAKAHEGASIDVRLNGQLVSASVTLQAFYDPEGIRLRE